MSIETIAHNGKRYAEIIWASSRVEKTTFFSPPESSFQFGLLAHEAGFFEPAHYHRPFKREINDLQQMFVVQRGVVAVHHVSRSFGTPKKLLSVRSTADGKERIRAGFGW